MIMDRHSNADECGARNMYVLWMAEDISAQLPFRSLSCKANRLACATNAGQSDPHGSRVLAQGHDQQYDSKDGNDNRSTGHIGHPLSPNGHFRLGIEITLSAATVVGGFWLGFQSLKAFVDSVETLFKRRKIRWRNYLMCLVWWSLVIGGVCLCVAPAAYWLSG